MTESCEQAVPLHMRFLKGKNLLGLLLPLCSHGCVAPSTGIAHSRALQRDLWQSSSQQAMSPTPPAARDHPCAVLLRCSGDKQLALFALSTRLLKISIVIGHGGDGGKQILFAKAVLVPWRLCTFPPSPCKECPVPALLLHGDKLKILWSHC